MATALGCACLFALSMIFSENRYPLFGIMLEHFVAATAALDQPGGERAALWQSQPEFANLPAITGRGGLGTLAHSPPARRGEGWGEGVRNDEKNCDFRSPSPARFARDLSPTGRGEHSSVRAASRITHACRPNGTLTAARKSVLRIRFPTRPARCACGHCPSRRSPCRTWRYCRRLPSP